MKALSASVITTAVYIAFLTPTFSGAVGTSAITEPGITDGTLFAPPLTIIQAPDRIRDPTEFYRIPRCPTGYHRIGHVCRLILPRGHHGNGKTTRSR